VRTKNLKSFANLIPIRILKLVISGQLRVSVSDLEAKFSLIILRNHVKLIFKAEYKASNRRSESTVNPNLAENREWTY